MDLAPTPNPGVESRRTSSGNWEYVLRDKQSVQMKRSADIEIVFFIAPFSVCSGSWVERTSYLWLILPEAFLSAAAAIVSAASAAPATAGGRCARRLRAGSRCAVAALDSGFTSTAIAPRCRWSRLLCSAPGGLCCWGFAWGIRLHYTAPTTPSPDCRTRPAVCRLRAAAHRSASLWGCGARVDRRRRGAVRCGSAGGIQSRTRREIVSSAIGVDNRRSDIAVGARRHPASTTAHTACIAEG